MKAFYEFTRLALVLWSFIAFITFFAAIGDLLFGRGTWRVRAWQFAVRLFFIMAWPLAIFSTRGRDVLIGHFTGI